jgi:hypothetical protein
MERSPYSRVRRRYDCSKEEEIIMRRLIAGGVVLAGLAVTSPVVAQPMPPSSETAETALIGLAVYSSDGERLGDITHAFLSGDQTIVRAEFGNVLGIGPVAVFIPAALFVQKTDRIEMRMTASEVKGRLAKQQQQQQKE